MILAALSVAHANDHVGLAVRGGINRFGPWNMVTVGGELRGHVGPVQILLGKEIYTVRRVLPPGLQLRSGIYSEWESVWPWNLGAVYGFEVGPLRPYAGADVIAANYYQKEWSVGARARGGVDYPIVPHLAANLNLAVGAWSGDAWQTIDSLVPNGGPIVQANLGLVTTF